MPRTAQGLPMSRAKEPGVVKTPPPRTLAMTTLVAVSNPTLRKSPGRGVEFMERKYEWHGKPPNPKEALEAIREIRTLGGRIRSEHE